MTKQSSRSTVFSLSNQMVGGAILAFPLMFKSAGIGTGIIVLALSCIISYITCRMYLIHTAKNQGDIEDALNRILGKKWQSSYRLITGIYLIFLNVIFVDIIVDQVFSIVLFILHNTGHQDWIAEKAAPTIVLDKWSIQYMTLVMFVPLLFLVSIKNINKVIRISEFGFISNMIYFAFITAQFFIDLEKQNIVIADVSWFSFDINKLAGSSSIAFTVHTTIVTVMKQNRNQQNNGRDLAISYFMSFILYTYVAIMGAFVVSKRECKTIIGNCFGTDWQVLLLQLAYLFAVSTVLPITHSVGRSRFIGYFSQQQNPSHFKQFNVFFMVISSIFSILTPYLPIDTMMNLVGAFICFYFVYLMPSFLHFKCLHPPQIQVQERDTLITSEDQTIRQTLIKKEDDFCIHGSKYQYKCGKYFRLFFLILINILGIGIMAYNLYNIFLG